MSKSVTPLESFTHLIENIPSWLVRLDELTAQVAEQNARFIRMSHCSEQLKRQKHNSTESLRPQEDMNMEGHSVIPNDLYLPPDPSHTCLSHASRSKAAANNALIAADIRRKRKSGSLQSKNSGHARYRTKSMIVVYYDSAIQEAFESLVRSIAGARNTLRKGKTTASFKARMSSLGMDDDAFSGAANFKMRTSKMMRPNVPRSQLEPELLNEDKSSCFEVADKSLETAQSLCEVAAHRFLRDGDCRLEIDGTRKNFQNCLELAQKEYGRLSIEEAEEKAKEAEAEAERQKPQDTPQEVETPVPVPMTMSAIEYVNEKMSPGIEAPAIRDINFPGTGTIEIDDGSDAESIHIDLSAIRRTSRRL